MGVLSARRTVVRVEGRRTEFGWSGRRPCRLREISAGSRRDRSGKTPNLARRRTWASFCSLLPLKGGLGPYEAMILGRTDRPERRRIGRVTAAGNTEGSGQPAANFQKDAKVLGPRL